VNEVSSSFQQQEIKASSIEVRALLYHLRVVLGLSSWASTRFSPTMFWFQG